MIVTFCGHNAVYDTKKVRSWLEHVMEDLILEGATTFYLGGYGDFDSMEKSVIRINSRKDKIKIDKRCKSSENGSYVENQTHRAILHRLSVQP